MSSRVGKGALAPCPPKPSLAIMVGTLSLCPPYGRCRAICGQTQRAPSRPERLPHHSRNKSGPAPRWLDVLLQQTARFLAEIALADIGPGPALVVGGAGGLAGLVALAPLGIEAAVVAAGPVDRGLDSAIARLDDACAAHAGNAAIVLHPSRHRALEPAHRAVAGIARIVETPGAATPVMLAEQRAIGGITGRDRLVRIVAAGTVEIGGLALRRACHDPRQTCERNQPRPEWTAYSHMRPLSTY